MRVSTSVRNYQHPEVELTRLLYEVSSIALFPEGGSGVSLHAAGVFMLERRVL